LRFPGRGVPWLVQIAYGSERWAVAAAAAAAPQAAAPKIPERFLEAIPSLSMPRATGKITAHTVVNLTVNQLSAEVPSNSITN
jgi:hypothetical protein